MIERDLARSALADERVKRLMTIPGIDMVVALALVAAIGEIERFTKPEKLVGYLGLNPSVRQSGPGPAYHGRITKQGRGTPAACWSRRLGPRHGRRARCAASSAGADQTRATCRRRRDGTQTRHFDLASTDQGRKLPLGPTGAARQEAARPRAQGRPPGNARTKGTAHAYNIKSHRDQERRWVEQAEAAYARFVTGWNPRGPRARTGAAKEERR